MLHLDDPRWKELDHRNWRDGQRSHWTPDAPYVPDELKALAEDPGNIERFKRLWPWICSESTTYPVAYAVVPYLVSFARALRPQERFEYLCVIGLIVTYSRPEDIKNYLADSYHQALDQAMSLTTETLQSQHDLGDTRYLLATVAALKGWPKLAEVLQDIDCIHGTCPKCGEDVYPDELQSLIV